jgi:beta-N-acetylhexosaminidase
MKDLIKQIGQLFLIGYPGEIPSPVFLDFLSEVQLGGVILFESNCPTYEIAAENIQRIKLHSRGIPPLIAIDQEGGRVCRLKGAPAEYRSAKSYGSTDDLEHFVEDYSRSALFMDSIGINLNLAPVADIFLNEGNDCLKKRCYGTSARQVAKFVEAAVTTSKRNRLLCCLKHFPGLGAAVADPHVQTPSADYSEMIWHQRERVPFVAGLEKGADLIMTTHLKLPKIDDKIVTGSEKIIRSMLRQTLAFDGPVVSDDLTMEGAAELGGIGERTVAAFNAGHDLLLFGQDLEASMQAYDFFVNACEHGEIDENRLETSLSRISGIKFKLESSVVR